MKEKGLAETDENFFAEAHLLGDESRAREVKEVRDTAATCAEQALVKLFAEDTKGPVQTFSVSGEYNVTVLIWRLSDEEREVHNRVAERKEAKT